MPTSELLRLANLGPKSVAWLNEAGMLTTADLAQLGSVGAFLKVEEAGFAPSLNLLWAIEGALSDIPWELIPPEIKQELKAELAAHRKAETGR